MVSLLPVAGICAPWWAVGKKWWGLRMSVDLDAAGAAALRCHREIALSSRPFLLSFCTCDVVISTFVTQTRTS